MIKFKELKTKPVAELERMLPELREQLRQLRFKVASKQLKNIREIRQIKQMIAQVLSLKRSQPATKKSQADSSSEASSN